MAGIVIHRDELWDDEHQLVGDISVTTPTRTAFDLGRRRGRTLAVVRVDALANSNANATGVHAAAVDALIQRHRGARGLRQLRNVVELMDAGAESPQETRTRLVLVVRVSAEMLRYRRDVILGRTCRALAEAGAEWPVIARFSGNCVA